MQNAYIAGALNFFQKRTLLTSHIHSNALEYVTFLFVWNFSLTVECQKSVLISCETFTTYFLDSATMAQRREKVWTGEIIWRSEKVEKRIFCGMKKIVVRFLDKQ
jgi:hypothetical protein